MCSSNVQISKICAVRLVEVVVAVCERIPRRCYHGCEKMSWPPWDFLQPYLVYEGSKYAVMPDERYVLEAGKDEQQAKRSKDHLCPIPTHTGIGCVSEVGRKCQGSGCNANREQCSHDGYGSSFWSTHGYSRLIFPPDG